MMKLQWMDHYKMEIGRCLQPQLMKEQNEEHLNEPEKRENA